MSNRILCALMLAICLVLAGSVAARENGDLLDGTVPAAGAFSAEGTDAGRTEAEEARIAEPATRPQVEAPAAENPTPDPPDAAPTESADSSPKKIDRQPRLNPWSRFRDAPGWRREFLPEGSYPPPTFFSPDMKPPSRSLRIVGPGVSPTDYYLGISLKSVDDTLRSHLKLPAAIGIVVESVSQDSPAATAGLQRHDVLTHADEQPITQYQELLNAVQKAGTEQRELTLALIRAGETQAVSVKPSKRAEDSRTFRWQPDGRALIPRVPDIVIPPAAVPGEVEDLPPLREPSRDWMLEQTRVQDELKQQIERLGREIDELREMLEEHHPPE